MSSNTDHITAVEFRERMKQGTNYERHVQELLEKTAHKVIRNVKVVNIEFDVVVIDKFRPLISLIEIKAYRSNLNVNRVRSEFKYFRDKSVKIISYPEPSLRCFTPYMGEKIKEKLTKRHLLFEKIGVDYSYKKIDGSIIPGSTPEGIRITDYIDLDSVWKFQLIFIVPYKSLDGVISAMNGKIIKYRGVNLCMINEIPTIILSDDQIDKFF